MASVYKRVFSKKGTRQEKPQSAERLPRMMVKRRTVPLARTAIALAFDKELHTSRGNNGLELWMERVPTAILGNTYPKRTSPTMQVLAGTTYSNPANKKYHNNKNRGITGARARKIGAPKNHPIPAQMQLVRASGEISQDAAAEDPDHHPRNKDLTPGHANGTRQRGLLKENHAWYQPSKIFLAAPFFMLLISQEMRDPYIVWTRKRAGRRFTGKTQEKVMIIT